MILFLFFYLYKIQYVDSQEIHQNCCKDVGFYVQNAPNSMSAGAPPQTPLGELTALPQTP